MINSQTLAMMRRNTARFLKDTCVLKRPQNVQDELGGSTNTFEIVNAALACRVLPLNDRGRNFTVGEGEQGRTYFRLIAPWDTEIGDGWQVEVAGITYEIQQVEAVHTDNTDVRARLMRLG